MTDLKMGLTQAEVNLRIHQFGFNEFEEKNFAEALKNALKILVDPMGLMLLVLSVVYWVLGEHQDAIILLIAYIPIVSVDVLLELRSQKALRALKKTLKSTCHVIRDGKTVSIPIRNIVPEDLLLLEEGQTIPADGNLVDASHLEIDESSLTGESIPVSKSVGQEALSGTMVLTGTGIVEVKKTGLASQIGSIAKVLKEFEAVPSPLLRSIHRIVKVVFLFAIGIAVLVFVEGILKSHGFASSLISALTLAMAAIPEEFPLVFTLYLSMAAYRLSKKGVLVKSLPAVEGLGRVDIICTDKTGTLTEGKFRLERTLLPYSSFELSEEEIQSLVFSCQSKAVDAMEASLFDWVSTKKGGAYINALHEQWSLEFDYTFDLKDKYMSHVWRKQGSDHQVMAMKGALEGVLKHCKMSEEEKKVILKQAEKEAEAGRRLLGLAAKTGKFSGVRLDDEQSLQFICILSFSDPVREGVKEAIALCIKQGIQIKMLTGDHLLTAHSIADKIALPHEHDELFSGPDLELLTVQDRKLAFQKGVIFARLKPEQKLELVEVLKDKGRVVAMTGDGINDAPALKLADVGISMGERATDVARSTAQLVLLKNDFSGIVAAVIEGRRVLNSLAQSFGYLIAFHIPIVSIALFQSLFLNSSLLLPIHIILMELIVHPVSAFVFDEPNASVGMRRKEFINRKMIVWSVMRGSLLTALSLCLFYFNKGSEETNRSLAVLVLVTGNIGLLAAEAGGMILAISNFRTRQRTWLAGLLLFALAAALAFIPGLTSLFSLLKPSAFDFTMISLLGVLIGFFSSRIPS